MVATHLEMIYSSISQERIETYRPAGCGDLEMMVTYLYNIALCEAFYTSLHFLEITLRNSLHAQLSAFYGSSTWYLLPGILESAQQNDIAKVTRRIVNRGKQATPGRVVSELNFGFWVSLLSGAYETRVWRPNHARALKASFPNIPNRSASELQFISDTTSYENSEIGSSIMSRYGTVRRSLRITHKFTKQSSGSILTWLSSPRSSIDTMMSSPMLAIASRTDLSKQGSSGKEIDGSH